MANWFGSKYKAAEDECALDLRARVALDIVRHFAIIAGQPDGEDSVGRAKAGLMPSADVAARANDIADAVVNQWETRGWIRQSEWTLEDAARVLGRVDRIKSHAAFARDEAQNAASSTD